MEAVVGEAAVEAVEAAMVVDLAAEATAVAGSAAAARAVVAGTLAAAPAAASMVAVIRWVAGRWAVCPAGDSAEMREVARSIVRPILDVVP